MKNYFLYLLKGYFICRESIFEKSLKIKRGSALFSSKCGPFCSIGRDSIISYSNLQERVSIGNFSRISSSTLACYVSVQDHAAVYKSNISSYSYIARNSLISATTIGRYCSVAPNVVCGAGMHPTNFISTSPVFYSTKKQCGFSFVIEDKYDEMPPVFIGADCFIGANSVILNGLSLGIGCVVASGSVVTKDVPPYAVVAGSPARIVKMRFPYHIIDNLLKSEWWTNEPNELLKNHNVFSSPYTEQHIFNL